MDDGRPFRSARILWNLREGRAQMGMRSKDFRANLASGPGRKSCDWPIWEFDGKIMRWREWPQTLKNGFWKLAAQIRENPLYFFQWIWTTKRQWCNTRGWRRAGLHNNTLLCVVHPHKIRAIPKSFGGRQIPRWVAANPVAQKLFCSNCNCSICWLGCSAQF